jgi:hypothetical protein
MLDELHDRILRNGRAPLNAAIGAGFDKLRRSFSETFRTMHSIQFESPWKKRQRDAGCA